MNNKLTQTISKCTLKKVMFAFAAIIFSMEPTLANAQAFDPILTVAQEIIDFINGPFGRAVAVIAIIGLGFLCFSGRLALSTAGYVVLGIGLVFGAPAIVDQLISSVGN